MALSQNLSQFSEQIVAILGILDREFALPQNGVQIQKHYSFIVFGLLPHRSGFPVRRTIQITCNACEERAAAFNNRCSALCWAGDSLSPLTYSRLPAGCL